MTGPVDAKIRADLRMWRWMILLLLFGAATYLLIKADATRKVELSVPLTFANLSENLFLSDAKQQSIRLVISGPPGNIARIDPAAILCRIDLYGLSQGTHTIPLSTTDILLPEGLHIEKLLTPSLTLQLREHPPAKEVDIVAVLEGRPAPGYAVAGVTLKPDRITIKGPASELAAIDTVKTKPIELNAASEPFRKEVPLNLGEPLSSASSNNLVIAKIDVRERIVTRLIEKLPVTAKGVRVGYQIDPQTIDLTVTGPEGVIKTIETDPSFRATVDLTDLTEGTHALKATINLPVRVKLVKAFPEQFEVKIGSQ